MNKCQKLLQSTLTMICQNRGESPPQDLNPLVDDKPWSFEEEVDLKKPKVIWTNQIVW